MTYYDRWNDRNREAKRQGEKDAFYGWRSHRYDYDSFTEPGDAYEDGYREERNRIERQEEERRQEEAHERKLEQERRWRMEAEEEEYHRQREEQEPDEYQEESEGVTR